LVDLLSKERVGVHPNMVEFDGHFDGHVESESAVPSPGSAQQTPVAAAA